MFNTLKYAKQLEEVGLTREQAEAHMQIMSEIVDSTLATKHDLHDLRTDFSAFHSEMRGEFDVFRTELKNDFSAFRTETHNEFKIFKLDVENRLNRFEDRITIKLGTIVSVVMAIAVAFLKLT